MDSEYLIITTNEYDEPCFLATIPNKEIALAMAEREMQTNPHCESYTVVKVIVRKDKYFN